MQLPLLLYTTALALVGAHFSGYVSLLTSICVLLCVL
jgi:hypothetical protein